MKYLAYIFLISLLRLLALFPRSFLYFISDIQYLFIYYIIPYRKKVTSRNLISSFPDLNTKEIKKMRKKFYRHLSDIILENAVITFYPKRRLEKMFKFRNPELVESYFDQGRSIILVTGHYTNWEWASPLSYTFRHMVIGVYKPLKNKYFDKAFIKARTRFGARVVPMGQIGRILFETAKKNKLTLTGMVGDQRPLKKHIHYWTRFLNQNTAVYTGSEKLAVKFNSVVVFMKLRKLKRGVYEAEIIPLTENPGDMEPYAITEMHTRILEENILENPSLWLWSHNRWKLSYENWLEMKGERRPFDNGSTSSPQRFRNQAKGERY